MGDTEPPNLLRRKSTTVYCSTCLSNCSNLKAHRLQREAKVLRVMQAQPHGSMDDWVKLAYDDVDPRIWPVAKRSLLAHMERIRSLGGFNL